VHLVKLVESLIIIAGLSKFAHFTKSQISSANITNAATGPYSLPVQSDPQFRISPLRIGKSKLVPRHIIKSYTTLFILIIFTIRHK